MLSIDVGFGNVKIYDGTDVAAFPSVYKETTADHIPSTDPDDQLLELDGVKYHVGTTALKMAGIAPFNKEDMLRHKIFMLTAICASTEGADFSDSVALGLPIGDYVFMADKLKKLKGKYEVKYNGKKCVIDVKKITVYAQSEAVYKLIAADTPAVKEEIIGIVDIGQKTVDFAYFDEGTFIKERSGSIEQGVINAYQSIASAVEEKLGFEIADYKAKKYIKKVPEDAQKAFSDMANIIKDRLFRKHWNFKEMDAVYIVGGGAGYVKEFFQDAPYRELDELTAVFANAYGYYKQ